MREIIFRGKSLNTGELVSGSLVIDHYDSPDGIKDEYKITDTYYGVDEFGLGTYMSGVFEEVDPATVGQFTGLLDKNGNKIFEGDILQGDDYPYCLASAENIEYNYYAEVVWLDGGCCGVALCAHKNPKSSVQGIFDGNCALLEEFDSNDWLIIGNIHDNPELIEENNNG